MQQILIVGAGGFCGAIARYAVTGFFHRRFPLLPWGTFAVNMAGCFLIGLLMSLILARPGLPEAVRLGAVTGFLGSLTTFSTFGYETVALVQQQELREAVANVAGNVAVGLGAVLCGQLLGRWIAG